MLNIMPLRKPLCWNRTENSEGLRADQRQRVCMQLRASSAAMSTACPSGCSATPRASAASPTCATCSSCCRIARAWGGPIDVSPSHLPMVGSLLGGRVHYALGFTGNVFFPSFPACTHADGHR